MSFQPERQQYEKIPLSTFPAASLIQIPVKLRIYYAYTA
jgi:hypothetical protein